MPYPPLPAPGNQDFQEETPTRSPAGPGHPTLKPGLQTRPAAFQRNRVPLVTPGGSALPVVTPFRLRFWAASSQTSGFSLGTLLPRPGNQAQALRGPLPYPTPALLRGTRTSRKKPLPVHRPDPGIPHLRPGY
ncbi:hypothetical protein ROHU_028395 [Labeo rohita]|uniref:Uncharacterized protein n=1 Tax=Labeo rohita TaxID=84645 RepID=A0A498M5B9_LABRO|nr:hypothetical protein ROHU_028395 [Labeo rohita]